MFTGIVTDIGRVRAIKDTNRDRRFEITTAYDLATIDIGASIAHSGCCLTVVEKGDDWFAVEVSAESLSLTTLSQWSVGARINLERATKVGDELGGHIVSGHVDGLGEHRLEVRAPKPLHRYIAQKGSIALEGVSLTVNAVHDDVFGVNIIPHTWDVTTLGQIVVGSRVNLEIDMLARYAARWQETA
jgi:riboflavin synthase